MKSTKRERKKERKKEIFQTKKRHEHIEKNHLETEGKKTKLYI